MKSEWFRWKQETRFVKLPKFREHKLSKMLPMIMFVNLRVNKVTGTKTMVGIIKDHKVRKVKFKKENLRTKFLIIRMETRLITLMLMLLCLITPFIENEKL